MAQDELGNRTGVAGQELAVGATGHTVMGCLNDFLGGKPLLPRGRRPTDL